MDTAALGIDAIDPWTARGRSLPEVRDRFYDTGALGLAIHAPPVVVLAERGELPLIGFHAFTTPEPAGEVFDPFAVLSVARLDTGEVLAAPVAVLRDEDDLSDLPPKPPSTVVAQFDLDVRERLPELSWTPGAFVCRVHLGARCSNRITVRLEGEEDGPPLPARAVWPRADHADPSALPRYRVDPVSLPPPRSGGLALALPQAEVEAGARCVLRGSFRLPVAPGDRARAECGDRSASAVLPISLLVVGRERPGPTVIALGVPSYEPTAVSAGETTGAFTLDLSTLPGFPRAPQAYTIWALSREALSEPVALVVTPPR